MILVASSRLSWSFKKIRLGIVASLVVAVAAITTFSASAKELAVLQDKSAKLTISDNFKCQSRARFTLTAGGAKFFDDRLQDIGALFNAGLRQVYATCPTLKRVDLVGLVGKFTVQKATASAGDGWKLQLERSELEKTALSLTEKVKGYSDLHLLPKLFERFRKIPRIAETTGYAVYAQQGMIAVNTLVTLGIEEFDSFAQELINTPQKTKGEDTRLALVIEVFSTYRPDLVPLLRARYRKLETETIQSEWDGVLAISLTPETELGPAIEAIEKQQKKRPLQATALARLDQRIAQWLKTRIQAHEASNPGKYLPDLNSHLAFMEELGASNIDPSWKMTTEVQEDALSWYGDYVQIIMEDHVSEAMSVLQDTGDNFTEVDLVLEVGFSLASEFGENGFSGVEKQIEQATADRIDNLLSNGLAPYNAELASLEMTPDVIAQLREQAAIFAELSEEFPLFEAYSAAVDSGIKAGRTRLCTSHAKVLSDSVGTEFGLVFEEQVIGLHDLTCALYGNDHLLENISRSWTGGTASFVIETADSELVSIDLVKVDLPNGSTGFADTEQGNSVSWETQLAALIIPPPSGKPDPHGITECDLLVGDPNDAGQPSRGVDFGSVPDDYDFERSIDACIAAVEHDPQSPRQLYQLARILEFTGEAEIAQEYALAAGAQKYPPALHQLAMATLTYGKEEDSFFDAIDLFKEASAFGYGPSKRELAQLMPPGVELYREIDGPTDAEIMRTMKSKICEGFGGYGACAIRTGVYRKNCNQVSADAFSCELVLRMRCEVNMGNDPVMRFFSGLTQASCPTRTDPMFMKFTKTPKGWTSRKEF